MTTNDDSQCNYKTSAEYAHALLLLAEKAVLRKRLLEINRELAAGRKGNVADTRSVGTHQSQFEEPSPAGAKKQKQKPVLIDPRQMLLEV